MRRLGWAIKATEGDSGGMYPSGEPGGLTKQTKATRQDLVLVLAGNFALRCLLFTASTVVWGCGVTWTLERAPTSCARRENAEREHQLSGIGVVSPGTTRDTQVQ